jgi:pyridoxine 4-dehydrogenase
MLIDLYFLHHVDPAVPLADSVGALGQLRQEGKIAAVGLSNVTVAQLDEARAVTPVDAVQNRLSYADPADLPTALACAERGLAYLAYTPLAGPSGPSLQAALAVARRSRASVQRVMLAWLLAQAPARTWTSCAPPGYPGLRSSPGTRGSRPRGWGRASGR